MSFKRKLISAAATSALAVAAFTTFAMAQDTNTTSDSDSTTQKQEMRRDRGFGGKRGGGRGMRGGKHGGGDRMLMRSLRQLNLSDAQQTQVKAIFENSKNSNQPQREEMRGLMMKKRDGVISAEEETRFNEIRTQIKANGNQLRDSILAVLTIEQKNQLDQMKQERKQRWEEKRQNRQNQTTTPSEVN